MLHSKLNRSKAILVAALFIMPLFVVWGSRQAYAMQESATGEVSTATAGSRDFFTNFSHYEPRTHGLVDEAGSPDWFWIATLVALNAGVMLAYARIIYLWAICYFEEKPSDRNPKLRALAVICAFCAVCGYGFNILVYAWPAYRLLALFLVLLNVASWRFAWSIQPFRKLISSLRCNRELAQILRCQNRELANHVRDLQNEQAALREANREIDLARAELERTCFELQQRNKDLDDFAYVASHDLKAPLRAIDNLARWINEDVEPIATSETLDDLKKMQNRVSRLDGLLDDLLEYSRTGRHEFEAETFALLPFLQESCAILDHWPQFDLQFSGDNPNIEAYPPPLAQVVRNLVENARKHHDRQHGSIAVIVKDQGDMVKVTVQDDGPGIASIHQDQVFEMFQTIKPRDKAKGSGMGLSVVRKQVIANGGEICVHSDGRGTRFVFTWPKQVFQLHEGLTHACAVSDAPRNKPTLKTIETEALIEFTI